MINNQLIAMLQQDLKNERKHLAFYMHSAVMVKGVNRKKLREFFEEEAQGEFKHVLEFSEAIVHLGGEPDVIIAPFLQDLTEAYKILNYASQMEFEVSFIYSNRLKALSKLSDSIENVDDAAKAAIAYLNIFYENQLEDSWKTAQEIARMLV